MTSRESWALTPATEKVTLADCPIGLFVNSFGRICLKTEYGNNAGRIDAYIVDSGEFFWGEHPQTIENQRKQLVTPLVAELTGKMVDCGDVTVNRDHVVSFGWDRRHYMNGSHSWFVVKTVAGDEIRIEYRPQGYGPDPYKIEKELRGG